jgi:hypothetical protein
METFSHVVLSLYDESAKELSRERNSWTSVSNQACTGSSNAADMNSHGPGRRHLHLADRAYEALADFF